MELNSPPRLSLLKKINILVPNAETIEKYILDDKEFDPLQKRKAEAQGYAYWEQVVEDSAKGANKDANTASLQMVMRNKFGWDKEGYEKKETHQPLVKGLAKLWRGKGNKIK